MKILFLFAVLAGFSITVQTQDTSCIVSGVVTDALGPVAGVKVSINRASEEQPIGTGITDDKGVYSLRVPPGSYFVQAERSVGRIVQRSGSNAIEATPSGNVVVNFTIPPV